MSDTDTQKAIRKSAHVPLDLDAEYDLLEEALKKISGVDGTVEKDRARELLGRLARSRNGELREDAQAVLRAAEADDWFGEKTPEYRELLRIARRSIQYHESQLTRCRLSRLILMSLFLVFLISAVAVDWTGAAPVHLTFPVLVGVGAVLLITGVVRWACARWTS